MQNSEFKDAFELFDRTGEGVVKWVECAPLARCFGFNPTDAKVRMLLCGSEEEEEQPTKADMEEKSINFEDFLPILWGVATAKDPGSYEDFYEGLKVSHLNRHTAALLYAERVRSSTRTVRAQSHPLSCVTS